MKVLVFGKTGQVARALADVAADHDAELIMLGRDVADLSDPVACRQAVLDTDADAIINAAAWTAVDAAEDAEAEAMMINADAPAAMAQAAAQRGLLFVHISTDYVFDGQDGPAWQPDDPTGPLGAYGRTKLAGEVAVTAAGGQSVILRTAWVFDSTGKNFVTTMLRLAESRDTLRVVADQFGGPTPAAAIADACLTIATSFKAGRGQPGIYHFSGAPDVSWADFARAIFARSGHAVTVEGIPTSEYPTPAVRPPNSRLDCSSTKTVFGVDRPDWGVALDGTGSRLWPITQGVSKQLMPIYDKPMIYYPLSVLMLSGIREIGIITTPEDQKQFQNLLGDGSQWGLTLTYLVQPKPEGLAQAYLVGEDFLDGHPSTMVLGDNIFFGHGLPELLAAADERSAGGTVFGYHVSDPERYGVVGMDADGRVTQIIEKPQNPPSSYAVTGLYFLDETAPDRARSITPSERGELEITSLLETYLDEGALNVERMGRGFAWLDTGTHGSLLDAGNFVRTLQSRQGMQTGCLEEIAYNTGWISPGDLAALAAKYAKNEYGSYLEGLLNE